MVVSDPENWFSHDATHIMSLDVGFRTPDMKTVSVPERDPPPNDRSVLWNSMIHPFLNMTIYGVIWYQGTKSQSIIFVVFVVF